MLYNIKCFHEMQINGWDKDQKYMGIKDLILLLEVSKYQMF